MKNTVKKPSSVLIRRSIRRLIQHQSGSYLDTRAIISCISKAFGITKQCSAAHVRWFRELGTPRARIITNIPNFQSDAMYM